MKIEEPVHANPQFRGGKLSMNDPIDLASLAKRHQQQLREKVLFKCIMCTFSIPSKTSLSEHMIKMHKEILEADIDESKTSKPAEQSQAMDEVDERIGYYKCNMCNYESVWLSALSNHKKQTHQNFRCTQCIFVSASESDMVFHWRLQHDTKRSNLKTIPVVPPSVGFKVQNDDRKRTSYECIMCTFKTYSKESLSQHIIKEHRDMLEEELEAQNNDNTGPQLAKIESEDEEVGYYKCNMCYYETVWMSHWSEHKRQSHQNFLWLQLD